MFLASIQLLSIGLLGEYLGRMFLETKRRPMYLIRSAALPQHPQQAEMATADIAAYQP